MRFLWSQMLWLLGLLPLLVAGYAMLMRRRSHAAARFPAMDLVRAAHREGRVRRHVPPALALLAIGAAAFALARPTAPLTLLAERMTVVLAIDVSASMEAKDAPPDRMSAAKLAAKSFVAAAPSTARIGIVSFSSAAAIVQQPTTDREAVMNAIEGLRPVGGTAIGSGVIAALVALFPEEAKRLEPLLLASKKAVAPIESAREPGSDTSRAIVLLTDGENTAGANPLDAAAIAAEHGVRVYTVAFGGQPPVPGNARPSGPPPSADENALRTIADITLGRHFSAAGTAQLLDAYGELGTELSPERSERELTALFCVAAVLLEVLAGTLSFAWFGRMA